MHGMHRSPPLNELTVATSAAELKGVHLMCGHMCVKSSMVLSILVLTHYTS